jgi:hypothetical protein
MGTLVEELVKRLVKKLVDEKRGQKPCIFNRIEKWLCQAR